jgi:hypothetical protein
MASIIHRNARPLFWGGDAIYGESVTWVISDQLVFHSSLALLIPIPLSLISKLTILKPSAGKSRQAATPLMLRELYAEQLGHAGYRVTGSKRDHFGSHG